jgi:hypothetical protein
VGFIGKLNMLRMGIGSAVYGNGLYAEFMTGTYHTYCDFTPIGNQAFFEHQALSTWRILVGISVAQKD